jgi:2-methylcitrate dehydratase PrpD
VTSLASVLQRRFGAPAPADARRKARVLALDTLGCALAALDQPVVARLAHRLSENDDGSLRLGALDARLSPASAAVLLATAACWDEACEGLARAHGRPGVPVVAACIALGMKHGALLGTFLEGVVSGYEVGGRMGERLRIRGGMHVDAGWPSLGVAAGVCRLLGEDASVAQAAVEIAASQLPFGLYLPVEQGADGRNTYLGHAAWLGIFAATAAQSGCAAPSGAVERHAELALLKAELPAYADPETYLIREAYLKPYAAVRHVHYAVEAALRLRQKASALDVLELRIYPEAVQYCGNRAPRTPIQAQFSLSFGIAAALRFGGLDASAYRSPQFEDVELRRVEALVRVRADESLGAGGRREAVLRIGTHEERISAVKGDPALPFTEEEACAKFLRGASAAIGGPAAERVARAMLDADETAPLRAVLEPAMRYK